MPVPLDTFVKQLTDSGVIAPGKLENFIPPKAQPKDAQELARQLVQSKQLTKYQAQEIYQGRAKSLIIGGYTIVDKIGAGGMGQVFKAEHRRMKRAVAIKVLPQSVTKDAVAVARFQREVEAAAKLFHPNIVPALDADEANGVHFLVMEYVEGSDLSALVKKNGPFPVDQAVDFILQAARGLVFAHRKGVIHRDIKPANLLLSGNGTIKILDMGLARIEADGMADAQAELTGTGAVMGTVDYMAPEQSLSTKHVDARADIYSLGCTLYYLIAGKPAYDGDTVAAKLLAHHTNPIPVLRLAQPGAPEQLEAVFQKMVAKQAADRYQSMSEVVVALEGCKHGHTTSFVVRPAVAPSSGSEHTTTFQKSPTPTSLESQQKAAASSRGKGNRKCVAGAAAATFGVAALAGVLLMPRTKEDGKQAIDATVELAAKETTAASPVATENMAIGADKSIDLLKLIDLKRDVCEGDWKIEKGTLTCGNQSQSMLNIAYIPPAEYQITLVAVRIGPPNAIDFGLQVGARRVSADIDASNGTNSGFSLISESDLAEQQLVAQDQPFFQAGIPTTIVYTVRNAVAELNVNGREICRTSPASRLSLPLWFAKKNLAPLFIATWSSFQITKLNLMPLESAGPSRATASSFAFNDPAFQQWMKDVAALSAEKQAQAVGKKLTELNPGFDGTIKPTIQDGVVTKLKFACDKVTNLSPVRALAGLKSLICSGSSPNSGRLSDLSPLQGMKLTVLSCDNSQVADLSPLRAMPLAELNCSNTQVSDLTPLSEMLLEVLYVNGTRVATLSPLKGMPLVELHCEATPIADLSPLDGMSLREISFSLGNNKRSIETLRLMKSIVTLGSKWDGQFSAEEFWFKYDHGELP